MKLTRRDEIWHSIDPRLDYSLYVEPGLKEIIEALRDLLDGRPVMVLFKNDMERGDDWRHLSTFPPRISKLPASLWSRRRIRTWSRLSNHLFRPVKSVYTGRNWPEWMIQLYDFLAGNDFNSKSVKVRLEEIPGLGKIQDNLGNGWLVEETRVNLSRLKLELLKEIHARGGIVLNYTLCDMAGSRWELADRLSGNILPIRGSVHPSLHQRIDSWTIPVLPWHDFSLYIIRGGDRISISEHAGQLRVTFLGRRNVTPGDFPAWLSVGSGSGYQNGETLSAGEKVFHNHFTKALNGFKCGASAGGDRSGLTEDLMETAFDLARQTGIDFLSFRTLYFRYGSAIEPMTEHAYALMETTRDPSVIWREAERSYQENYEWLADPGMINDRKT